MGKIVDMFKWKRDKEGRDKRRKAIDEYNEALKNILDRAKHITWTDKGDDNDET